MAHIFAGRRSGRAEVSLVTLKRSSPMEHISRSLASDDLGSSVATGIISVPDAPSAAERIEAPDFAPQHPYLNVGPSAADTLVKTVFGGVQHRIRGIRYATAYKLAEA